MIGREPFFRSSSRASRRTDVPSMQIKPGDVIQVREGSRSKTLIKDLMAMAEDKSAPDWITRNVKDMSGGIIRLPERAEIEANLNEQLIVEYYSR